MNLFLCMQRITLRWTYLNRSKKYLGISYVLEDKLLCPMEDKVECPTIVGRYAQGALLKHSTSGRGTDGCSHRTYDSAQGVDERLKASDQMRWVRMMNNIRNSAEELVIQEIVFD